MTKHKLSAPPQWPIKALHWFYDENRVEGIVGDLYETYEHRLERSNPTRARLYFYRDLLSMLRPNAIRKRRRFTTPNFMTMFSNYFKLTLRGIKAELTISLISILGLAISISCCIVLFIFGRGIVTANDFIKDSDNIHLIYSKAVDVNNDPFDWSRTPELLGTSIQEDAGGSLLMSRYQRSSAIMRYESTVIEETVQYVDDDFLDIFSFELANGSRESLKNGQLVLSAEVATKFFADQDPVGKEVMFIIDSERVPMIVGAVGKDLHSPYFSYNILMPFTTRPATDDWKNLTNATFIKSSDKADFETLKSKKKDYIDAYNAREPKYRISDLATIPFSLLSTHQHDIAGSVVGRENESTLTVAVFFGSLLLFIACFNYINIALVAASKKLKEIGLRKSVGASRKQLIVQFLSQNIILSFFAVFSGLLIAYLLLVPLFDSFFPMDFVLDLTDWGLWVFLVVIAFITGLISGGYPAFYISSFSAVNIFSGKGKFGSNRNTFFKIFLGLQFGISFLIIFSGIAFFKNSRYQEGLSWGYDQNGVLTIPVESAEQFTALRDNLSQLAGVESVSGAAKHIGRSYTSMTFDIEGEKKTALSFPVTVDYLQTMEIDVVEGRSFDVNRGNEMRSLVVNETFAKKFFIEAIPGSFLSSEGEQFEIIGLVDDFHYRNFYASIDAVAFKISREEDNKFLVLRTDKDNLASLNDLAAKEWHKLFPDYPYSGYLQADVFERYFREMSIPTNSLITFAIISVILSSVGLFGLVSLMISRRLKEIGVRKVLGARMLDLALLTNKPYAIILGVALLIATPLSQNLVEGYLKQVNAYPVAIDYKIIIPAIVILSTVILLTISANLYKVSTTNPTETLRDE